MTWQNEIQQLLFSKTLFKRALQGAGIAFVLISIFILGTLAADAKSGSWVLIPMSAVTVGGAFGGAFYFIMELFRHKGGWKKVVVNIISVLVYFLTLYFSLILALNAMGLWN